MMQNRLIYLEKAEQSANKKQKQIEQKAQRMLSARKRHY